MNKKSVSYDPIVEEIHRTREQIAEKFGFDSAAILEDAQKRQAASGRPVWKPPAKKKSNASTNKQDDQ